MPGMFGTCIDWVRRRVGALGEILVAPPPLGSLTFPGTDLLRALQTKKGQSMKVEIEITGPGLVDHQFTIVLAFAGTVVPLAGGFASEPDALAALVDCLTYMAPPPPDLTEYDEALTRLGDMLDRVGIAEEALTQARERIENLEEAFQAVGVAAPAKRVNPLLAGREVAAQHQAEQPAAAAAPQRPSIRRQSTADRIAQEGGPTRANVTPHNSYGGPIGRGGQRGEG